MLKLEESVKMIGVRQVSEIMKEYMEEDGYESPCVIRQSRFRE